MATSTIVIMTAVVIDRQAGEHVSLKQAIVLELQDKLTSHRHITRILQRSRHVAHPEYYQADESPRNGTDPAICQGIYADRPSLDVAAHDEDLEEHLAPAENLLEDAPHADGFPDNLDRIAEIPHERIGLPELPEYDSGIGCQDGQHHDQDDTGYETNGGQRRGQR